MANSDVLFISLDSCRYDTFEAAYRRGKLPHLQGIGPLHRALAPSHFTYGSHAAFWMGFTPGSLAVESLGSNPKAGKLFRMAFAGHTGVDGGGAFRLIGSSIVEGFRRQGYLTLGSGSVNWFDTATETGSVLAKPFEHFHFAGNTWSLQNQLDWLEQRMAEVPNDRPRFVFLQCGGNTRPLLA